MRWTLLFHSRTTTVANAAVIQEYRAQHYERLLDGSEHIQIVAGKASLISDHEVEVQSAAVLRHLVGDQLLIATGSAPTLPNIPGLAQVPYLTSDLLSAADDPSDTTLREQPRSLIILGGCYIALELGQMFARFGTEVTIVTRGRTILSGYEPEIIEALTAIFQEEGLRLATKAQVRSVDRQGAGVALVVQQHGSQQTLGSERLLIATGRRPNTQALGLERAGVEVDQSGAVRVDRTLRTSVPISGLPGM